MLFSWLKRRRRRKLLATPFPEEWESCLSANVRQFEQLDANEQARLRDKVRIFIAEKHWEGCGGLMMNEGIQVTIAGMACLLILNIEHEWYKRLISILVYPDTYVALESRFPGSNPEPVGVREGESWVSGSIVLNWAEIQQNIEFTEGTNLVFHEFAHQLDAYDRYLDGTPELDSTADYRAWRMIMTEAYSDLVDDARHGRKTLLDHYGATDEAEFFAVCTECFFEMPQEMQEWHPRLYELLADYYRQDPAERV